MYVQVGECNGRVADSNITDHNSEHYMHSSTVQKHSHVQIEGTNTSSIPQAKPENLYRSNAATELRMPLPVDGSSVVTESSTISRSWQQYSQLHLGAQTTSLPYKEGACLHRAMVHEHRHELPAARFVYTQATH